MAGEERVRTLQERAEAVPRDVFLGGPRKDFERLGRHMFVLLLKEGLLPQHKVLDIGAGALRAGYWYIHFLDPGGYCGIEPHPKMLKAGRELILEPGLETEKKARFSDNDRFDFSVFGERFNFAIARSMWTHASKKQISAMLDGWTANAAPGGRFFASYFPAHKIGVESGAFGKKALRMRDYTGDEWVGASHERKQGGLVAHRRSWVKQACAERNLKVEELKSDVLNRQRWLRITAPG